MATIQPLLDIPDEYKQMDLSKIQTKIKTILPSLEIKENKIIEILEERNAGLIPVIDTLSNLMHFGTSEDTIRLRATEIALKLHGALKEDNGRGNYNFTFVIKGEDVNLQQILQPER